MFKPVDRGDLLLAVFAIVIIVVLSAIMTVTKISNEIKNSEERIYETRQQQRR